MQAWRGPPCLFSMPSYIRLLRSNKKDKDTFVFLSSKKEKLFDEEGYILLPFYVDIYIYSSFDSFILSIPIFTDSNVAYPSRHQARKSVFINIKNEK